MNKQLSPDEVANLSMLVIDAPMTKRAKLLRLAHLARSLRGGWFKSAQAFRIYHSLEHYSDEQYNSIDLSGSVFALAATDPVLREAGYTAESLGDAKRFFELSREDLHEFSCNCGGEITNQDMADRIEKIANR